MKILAQVVQKFKPNKPTDWLTYKQTDCHTHIHTLYWKYYLHACAYERRSTYPTSADGPPLLRRHHLTLFPRTTIFIHLALKICRVKNISRTVHFCQHRISVFANWVSDLRDINPHLWGKWKCNCRWPYKKQLINARIRVAKLGRLYILIRQSWQIILFRKRNPLM